MRLWSAAVAVLTAVLLAPAAGAQQASTTARVAFPVLVIDSERLFSESAFGKRLQNDLAAQEDGLRAENAQIQAQLAEEERALTERRQQVTPEEFRALADAFDEKVETIRRQQDGKSLDLGRRRDEERLAFYSAAQPVLATIMREAGAVVILDDRSVFLSDAAINITPRAIQRIDAELGDGVLPPPPKE